MTANKATSGMAEPIDEVDRILAQRSGWDDPELCAPDAYLDEDE